MDLHRKGIDESNLEFWPVEHPVDPMEKDQPVKCPKIPDASAVNVSIISSFFFFPTFSFLKIIWIGINIL